jgi:hypothetical protein
MESTERCTSAEHTALNVFHDLQLAHVRQQEGAPERAARREQASTDAPTDAPTGVRPVERRVRRRACSG